jgi:hypothetical protein
MNPNQEKLVYEITEKISEILNKNVYVPKENTKKAILKLHEIAKQELENRGSKDESAK